MENKTITTTTFQVCIVFNTLLTTDFLKRNQIYLNKIFME